MNLSNLSDDDMIALVRLLPDEAFANLTIDDWVNAYLEAYSPPQSVRQRMAENFLSGASTVGENILHDLSVAQATAEREVLPVVIQ